MSTAAFFRRLFCKHSVYIEDIKRHDYETNGFRLVEAPCNRCGKRLTAIYGLALNAKLAQRPAAIRALGGGTKEGQQ